MHASRASTGQDWWRQAACAHSDTDWWTDTCPDRARGVRICLGCPVQEPCLADGLAHEDVGVIRGARLLRRAGSRTEAVRLVCAHCGCCPVRFTPTGISRYCDQGCTEAARRSRAERRTAGRHGSTEGSRPAGSPVTIEHRRAAAP
ncbi:WhiB family transcriptional regulator [Micromonospora marina]|uniref:WhiB family transcriptional regulator n=1 Tax=Micromonospora marina TaxID=307120 RepID=UPI003453F671